MGEPIIANRGGWMSLGTSRFSLPSLLGSVNMTQVGTLGNEGFRGRSIGRGLKGQGHLKWVRQMSELHAGDCNLRASLAGTTPA